MQEIGSYLPVPQVLILLNRTANKTFSEQKNYCEYIAERFGICTLSGCEDAKEMLWFNDFSFVKDKKLIFDSLCHALFDEDNFPVNGAAIAGYIYESLDEYCLDSAVKENLKESIVKYFLKKEKYRFLCYYFDTNPLYFEKILNDYDKMTFIFLYDVILKWPNHLDWFEKVYDNLQQQTSRTKFLSAVISFDIYRYFYMPKMLSNFTFFYEVILSLFDLHDIEIDHNFDEFFRIKISSIIREAIKSDAFKKINNAQEREEVKNQFTFLKLLNEIQFGSKTKIEPSTVLRFASDGEKMQYLTIAACYKYKSEIFQVIFDFENVNFFEIIKTRGLDIFEIGNGFFTFSYLNLLTNENREIFCNRIDFLETAMNIVIIEEVKEIDGDGDDDSEIIFTCSRRFNLFNQNFNFRLKTSFLSSGNYIATRYLLSFLFQKSSKTLKTFLESFLNCSFFKNWIKSLNEKPIFVNFDLIKLICESENLINLIVKEGIKFTVNTENWSEVLDLPIQKIQKFTKISTLNSLLKIIKEPNLIKKLEIFLNQNISEIFKQEILNQTEIDNFEEYLKYKHLFKYWIKSSQKHEIHENLSKFLLKQLKRDFSKDFKQSELELEMFNDIHEFKIVSENEDDGYVDVERLGDNSDNSMEYEECNNENSNEDEENLCVIS